LSQAVQVMARYQLGRKLADEQVSALIAFLKSLSGELAPDSGVKPPKDAR
jgi:cytochrome c peroxidase